MLIDWFTVIAQILNFLILVYLLYRFLYKPITKATGKRQQKLQERWQSAEAALADAEEEAAHYHQQQQELQQRRQSLLQSAQEKAEQQRQELIQTARQAVKGQQDKWQQALEREQREFLRDLRQQLGHQTYGVARQALQDLANADLEKQTISTFLERLQRLDEQQRQDLTTLGQQSDQEITIRSSFDLSSETRDRILQVLQSEQIADHEKPQFIKAPDLIWGIELEVGDQKVAWNISHYLDSLEAQFQDLLQQESQAVEDSSDEPLANDQD